MKHGKRNRGVRRSDDAESISLFPFLAVLICAAGLLIVLLVIMGRHARAAGTRLAEAKRIETQKDLKQQREDVRWRIDQLQQSLEATRRQLVDARLDLGHLEDHSRKLRQELAALERDWSQLTQPVGSADQAAVEAQFRELSSRIAETRSRIAEARRGAMAKQPSYAIVPYEGPHGTRRRPIYLECRSDAVVVQPEGIELRSSDFEGPLGPGNPLAAAMRAAREYLLRAGQFDAAKSGEPYPLLLVRPRGIHAYYAAREAMSSWESDFGYEMIDADWQLDFGPPDPELARLLREEIEAARARQVRLAEAAPSHYRRVRAGSGGSSQYTVSSGGVVVPYGQTADKEEEDSDAWAARRRRERAEKAAASALAGVGSGGGQSGSAGARLGGTGMGGTGIGGIASGGNGANGYGASETGSNGTGADPTGGESLLAGGTGTPGGSASLLAGGGSGIGPDIGSNRSPGGPSAGGAASGTTGGAPGGSPGGSTGTTAGGTAGCPMGGAASNGSRQVAGTATYPPTADQTSQMSGAAAGGAPRRLGEWYPHSGDAGPAPPGSETSDMASTHKPPRKKEKSLADKRGRDWATPNATPTATPITQPVHVECHADRIDLVAQRGLAGGRSIAWKPQPGETVEELVSAVQKYTEGWGMAGNGMYWQPVLHVYVCPGAEDHYQDLQDLLRDSGLRIERKN